jgi:anti-sigma regulatory factor (Ser/Thr protein kinase)
MDADLVLTDSGNSVRQAREVTARLLARWGCAGGCVDDAVLVVSEMVTNAVRHGRGRVRLRLHWADGHLRVEVRDASARLPKLLPPSPTAERGRGLRIVSRLASRWGSARLRDGKVVWVDLECPRGPPGKGVDVGMPGLGLVAWILVDARAEDPPQLP